MTWVVSQFSNLLDTLYNVLYCVDCIKKLFLGKRTSRVYVPIHFEMKGLYFGNPIDVLHVDNTKVVLHN